AATGPRCPVGFRGLAGRATGGAYVAACEQDVQIVLGAGGRTFGLRDRANVRDALDLSDQVPGVQVEPACSEEHHNQQAGEEHHRNPASSMRAGPAPPRAGGLAHGNARCPSKSCLVSTPAGEPPTCTSSASALS